MGRVLNNESAKRALSSFKQLHVKQDEKVMLKMMMMMMIKKEEEEKKDNVREEMKN